MGSIRFVAVIAMIVMAAACAQASDETTRSSNGAIVEPGRLGIAHLRPGDCLRDRPEGQVEAMVGVPCNRDHQAQVVAIGESVDVDIDDPAVIDGICTAPVEDIGRTLQGRDDLPVLDLALLYAQDGSRVACVLEFAEPITEDLVRGTA